ncbi:hypothetical protein C8J57DRAFT_148633 [Mycena rebaudengoi]|nr:hypothetical protein C8J57DRAFT_148633 [Mycena rebaudengoi]
MASSLFFLLLCLPFLTSTPTVLALAAPGRISSPPKSLFERALWQWRRDSLPRRAATGYFPPADGGGSMMTKVVGTQPPGQGEPVNIILAGTSSPAVLVDQEKDGGFRNFILSIGFSGECLGQHAGNPQQVDLGDGNGYLNETAVLRWNYGDPQLGTCQETIQGGNHFRYWKQDGKSANTSAIFMATSSELPVAQHHSIVVNGYNLGRDYLIGNITKSAIPTANLTSTSTFSGTTSSGGYTYSTTIAYVSGLLSNTSIGVNHNESVSVDGVNAIDGLVAVMEVQITASPASASSAYRTASLPSLALIIPLLLSTLCI